jgi:Phospholipid methyltransferase
LRCGGAKTTFHPGGKASALVRGCIFQRSRNPMYLGLTLFTLGPGNATANPWMILLAPLLLLYLQERVVKREEAHLSRRFGDSAASFRRRRRRGGRAFIVWLPLHGTLKPNSQSLGSGVMIERAFQAKEQPIPLSLAAGQRIVTPGLDPVLGWIGGEKARTAQALIFPQWLLEPRPTENIVYACNLPASAAGISSERSAQAAEGAFLAASLPGGQVRIVLPGGEIGAVFFRWARLAAHYASMGAVWRCYLKLRTPSNAASWTALTPDYVFDASSGFLVNGPGRLKLTLENIALNLTHPEGRLTCFPAQAGRVKVTRASADGWARRELLSLRLEPDRRIVARFSDGDERAVAMAAAAKASILAA